MNRYIMNNILFVGQEAPTTFERYTMYAFVAIALAVCAWG